MQWFVFYLDSIKPTNIVVYNLCFVLWMNDCLFVICFVPSWLAVHFCAVCCKLQLFAISQSNHTVHLIAFCHHALWMPVFLQSDAKRHYCLVFLYMWFIHSLFYLASSSFNLPLFNHNLSGCMSQSECYIPCQCKRIFISHLGTDTARQTGIDSS